MNVTYFVIKCNIKTFNVHQYITNRLVLRKNNFPRSYFSYTFKRAVNVKDDVNG